MSIRTGSVAIRAGLLLAGAGAEVIVLEAGERTGGGASRGNAGAICPSMVQPLAAPGTVRAALADLPRPDAALHVHPAYLPKMAGFLTRFARSSTTAAYDRGVHTLTRSGCALSPEWPSSRHSG